MSDRQPSPLRQLQARKRSAGAVQRAPGSAFAGQSKPITAVGARRANPHAASQRPYGREPHLGIHSWQDCLLPDAGVHACAFRLGWNECGLKALVFSKSPVFPVDVLHACCGVDPPQPHARVASRFEALDTAAWFAEFPLPADAWVAEFPLPAEMRQTGAARHARAEVHTQVLPHLPSHNRYSVAHPASAGHHATPCPCEACELHPAGMDPASVQCGV
eukprot:364213-Chlamydomonas_euryale.AAC.5